MTSLIESLKALCGRKGGVCPPDTETPACEAGAQENNNVKANVAAISDLFRFGKESVPSMDEASFRKQLGWLVKEQPVAVKMTINPGMAKVMLERNNTDEWKNRPASAKGVERFARCMSSGRWHYTAETIVFSVSGRLLNGQHRLHACINSGAEIVVLVAFGVEDDAFKYMDIGVTRTAGHIFAIEGVPNYNWAAAVTRLVYSYLTNKSWSGSSQNSVGLALDSDQLYAFYLEHQGIQDGYAVARKLGDEGLISQRWGGFLYYICAQKNPAAARTFFEKVASDLGHNDPKAPEYLLRKRMIQSAKSSGDNKVNDLYLAAYTVQAWNAKRRGDKRSIFRWRGEQNPNEAFPRAIQ